MSEAKYCDDCSRMIGVGCACGMTFAEKLKFIRMDSQWMPNASPIEVPDSYKQKYPNSRLSSTPPPPL